MKSDARNDLSGEGSLLPLSFDVGDNIVNVSFFIRCSATEFYLHHPRRSPGRDGAGSGLFREAALRDLRVRSSLGTGRQNAPSEQCFS